MWISSISCSATDPCYHELVCVTSEIFVVISVAICLPLQLAVVSLSSLLLWLWLRSIRHIKHKGEIRKGPFLKGRDVFGFGDIRNWTSLLNTNGHSVVWYRVKPKAIGQGHVSVQSVHSARASPACERNPCANPYLLLKIITFSDEICKV